jgi:hypothetical protein
MEFATLRGICVSQTHLVFFMIEDVHMAKKLDFEKNMGVGWGYNTKQ